MGRLRIDRLCRRVAVVRDDVGAVLVGRCYVADGRWSRLIGLLGTSSLAGDEGLWLEPCSSVHTFGMRMPIACLFLDADGRVVRTVDPLPAWRVATHRGARAVVEVPAGSARGTATGRILRREPG